MQGSGSKYVEMETCGDKYMFSMENLPLLAWFLPILGQRFSLFFTFESLEDGMSLRRNQYDINEKYIWYDI